MDDVVQPTASEAISLWNGLEASERARLVAGLDYQHDVDLVSKLEARNMVFYTDPPDVSDDAEAFEHGVQGPPPMTQAVFADELQLIIDRGDQHPIDE